MGLLETHNVDKSLEGKLKCLIFIPIISQTYCDIKSFASQKEFCVFNKMAREDQFGRPCAPILAFKKVIKPMYFPKVTTA